MLVIRKTSRVCYYAFAALLMFSQVGVAQPPMPPFGPAPATPQAMGDPINPRDAGTLDEPLRLIGESRRALQDIKDYGCVLIKQERINGQLTAEQIIALEARNQPFAVHMRWMDPKDMTGQEVCFDSAVHGNKMRVHPVGGIGLVKWVTIDQKDPRAMKANRHSISEAGLANLVERYTAAWQAEKPLGKTRVNVADFEYNKRRCTRVETVHPVNTVGQFDYYRTVIYFDQESKLPIRVECYDYPRGAGDGDLVESYSYVNLRFNLGLGDDVFRK